MPPLTANNNRIHFPQVVENVFDLSNKTASKLFILRSKLINSEKRITPEEYLLKPSALTDIVVS